MRAVYPCGDKCSYSSTRQAGIHHDYRVINICYFTALSRHLLSGITSFGVESRLCLCYLTPIVFSFYSHVPTCFSSPFHRDHILSPSAPHNALDFYWELKFLLQLPDFSMLKSWHFCCYFSLFRTLPKCLQIPQLILFPLRNIINTMEKLSGRSGLWQLEHQPQILLIAHRALFFELICCTIELQKLVPITLLILF